MLKKIDKIPLKNDKNINEAMIQEFLLPVVGFQEYKKYKSQILELFGISMKHYNVGIDE